MAAVLYAGADSVKLLLDRGADPNATNKVGASALMWAAPDLIKSRLLIAAGADVNARAKNTERTPLLVAASYPGSVPVLQLLLDHGANIHAKDRRGVHALGRATLSADVDVVRFLVEHGCDPNEPGYGTPVRYARQYLPSLKYLLAKGARVEKDALAQATHWQDPKLIAQWIDRGADVNATAAPYNRTALMARAARLNSIIDGVHLGVQTYSYRDLPMEGIVDAVIKAMTLNGLSECELFAQQVEPPNIATNFWAGIDPKVLGAGADGVPLSQQLRAKAKEDAVIKARDDLRKWRLEVSLDHFREIRKKFDAAGINIHVYNLSFITALQIRKLTEYSSTPRRSA